MSIDHTDPAHDFPWRDAPRPSAAQPTTPRRHRLTIGVLFLAMIGAGPAARVGSLAGAGWALVVVGASLALTTAAVRYREQGRVGPLEVTGAVAALGLITYAGGRVVGIWALLGVATTVGAVSFLRSSLGRERLAATIAPLAGLAVGAALLGALDDQSRLPLLIISLAVVLAWAGARWPSRASATERHLRTAVATATTGLGTACFALLSIPFVVLPWIVGRLVRWDTTWSPSARGSAWVTDRDASPPSSRPWTRAVPARTWPWTRRAHRSVIRLAVVLVVLAAGFIVIRDRARAPDPRVIDAAAMADSPFWPELSQALEELRPNMELYSYAYRSPDVSSRYLNIVGGHRVSWQPPIPASCRPSKVWVYGGSTVFGEGQRDEHTIPSELARAAWRDGYGLDVENRGVLGDALWIETRRLEEDLGTATERPDLVVFYDGANEVITRVILNDQGRAGDMVFASYLDTGLFLQIDRYLGPAYQFFAPTGKLEIDDRPQRTMGANAVAQLAERQYRISLESSRRVVDANDIDTIWFNQPTQWSQRLSPDEQGYLGDHDQFGRDVTGRYIQALPGEVVDLSGIFDDAREPVFYDTAHHNEQGAAMAAAEIWDQIEPRLEKRCSPRGS